MIDPKSEVGMPSVKYGSSDTFPITTEEYNRLEADSRRYRILKSMAVKDSFKCDDKQHYNLYLSLRWLQGESFDDAIDGLL